MRVWMEGGLSIGIVVVDGIMQVGGEFGGGCWGSVRGALDRAHDGSRLNGVS